MDDKFISWLLKRKRSIEWQLKNRPSRWDVTIRREARVKLLDEIINEAMGRLSNGN